MASGPGWLFVPADRPERFAKAIEHSDLAIIDLEDAIRKSDKAHARSLMRSFAFDSSQVCVRINGLQTEYAQQDIECARELGITTIMVPMAEADQPFDDLEGFEVIALVETAQGVIEAARIAEHPTLTALALGSADLKLSLRSRNKTTTGFPDDPLVFARMQLLFAARTRGLKVIDSVHPSVHDIANLVLESEASAAYGFDGKLAIHPKQIPSIRTAFAPTADEISWAEKVVGEARIQDSGTFTLNGELVDEVVIRRARSVLGSRT